MAPTLYPPIIHENDLSPDAVGPEIEEACKEIYEACKGFGTNEKRLIKALATKDATARFQISIKYKDLYGKELRDVIKKECGGDMGLALQYLAAPLNVAESMMIKKACGGMGTNEGVLYPIIVGRTNDEITILKRTYFDEYNKDLTVLIAKETRGDFESILFNCLQGSEEAYDADYHTDEKVKSDVQGLYKAGQGRMGTNEKGIFKELCAYPSTHLKKVNLEYADKHGYTLFKALEKEFGGDAEDASTFLVGMKLKPAETVAKLIKKACSGMGTNELLLTCTLIRYQAIMKEVQEAFQELYGKSVQDIVKKETRGDYEDVLVAVVDCGCSS